MNFVPLFFNASATVSDASVSFPAYGLVTSTPLGVVADAPNLTVALLTVAAFPDAITSFESTLTAFSDNTLASSVGSIGVSAFS